MILGLAGKSGAGKNLVADFLEARGWKTLDLDQVAHRALSVLADRMEQELGPGLLGPGGMVDRRELGRRVFSNPAQLVLLEKITYPWIEKEAEVWLAENAHSSLVLHGINLHKTRLVEELDALLWIRASVLLRLWRVRKRDQKPLRELWKRFRNQNKLTPQLYSGRVRTMILRNGSSRWNLKRGLDKILLTLSATSPS